MNKTEFETALAEGRWYEAALILLERDLKTTLGDNKHDTNDQLEVYLDALAEHLRARVANWPE